MKYKDFDKCFEEWKEQQLDIPTLLLMKIYELMKDNSKVVKAELSKETAFDKIFDEETKDKPKANMLVDRDIQIKEKDLVKKKEWNTQKSQKTSKKSSGRNS